MRNAVRRFDSASQGPSGTELGQSRFTPLLQQGSWGENIHVDPEHWLSHWAGRRSKLTGSPDMGGRCKGWICCPPNPGEVVAADYQELVAG